MGEVSLDFVSLFAAGVEPLFVDALIGGDRAGDDFCLDVGGSLISGRDRLFTCLVAACLDDVFNGFVFGVGTCFCFREVVVGGSESELTVTSSYSSSLE